MTGLGESANDWGYRPHLDGLRAVAVYLVVLFHSGSFRFSGGFIGVDLFFVLSGFLVTSVLLVDASTGEIRFARFYARRARRLIPAASLTIVVVSLMALLVSRQLDRAAIVPDARAASLWYANWHFIAEANDYFASGDMESPLLHFWSLAVEEQFYLVFPLVLFVVIRLCRRRLKPVATVMGGLLVAGVILQWWWSRVDATHAYLGTDARLYQPLAGVVLAVVLWRVRCRDRWPVVGDALLGSSVVSLVVLATVAPGLGTSWRGFGAVAIAVLAILGGELRPTGWVATALSLPPVRYLGTISYGTYLWHWPVVAFSRRLLVVSPPAMFVLSAGLGTAIAALSYQVVEQPIRTAPWLRQRSVVSVALGVASAMLVGLGVAPFLLHQPARPQVSSIPSFQTSSDGGGTPVPDLDWDALKNDRIDASVCTQPDASDCLLREGEGSTVFIMGDSHARMWAATVMVLADQYDWTVYLAFNPACLWPEGVYTKKGREVHINECLERRPLAYQQLESVDPDLVVLAERGVGAKRGFALERAKLLAASNDAYGALDGRSLLRQASIDSIGAITADSDRAVLLIEPIPEVTGDALECLSGAEFVEQCTLSDVSDSFEEDIYRDIATSSPQVSSLDVDERICLGLCPAMIDDVVVRRDDNHLTSAFARRLADRFDEAIQQLDVEEVKPDGLGG